MIARNPATAAVTETAVTFRPPEMKDVDRLVELENRCFRVDRLSRRSFRHWVQSPTACFLLAEKDQQLLGYGLVSLPPGTRLARLYSLAVSADARGLGLGRKLLTQLEEMACDAGRLFMRLEVEENNHSAIHLYESSGYRQFGEYQDYYQDHSTALRMQKCIRTASDELSLPDCPWYSQTTDFTCGPSALMMAMAAQRRDYRPSQSDELDIWRQATTIFMTSGHGGCHPVGLALAAVERGFEAEVVINHEGPLFLDGVRSAEKKQVMSLVDHQFRSRAEELGLAIQTDALRKEQIRMWIEAGYSVMVLISTYRFEGRKAPHWVAVTAMDDVCLYVHDPDPGDDHRDAFDCQHLPVALLDFDKMASYGSGRLQTAVAIRAGSAQVLAGN